MSGAAESETHDPKTKRKKNPKPTQKKKKPQIEMHKKILNSIQFDSICKCCLTVAASSSAFHLRLGTTHKV